MSKYVRNDDKNDDNEVYNQETYPGMTIFHRKSPHQELRVFGKTEEEKDVLKKVTKAKQKLSKQEVILLALVCEKGYNLSKASRVMGISQPMASKYWSRIRAKLA